MTIYIPFGYNCTPADILKFGGLRTFSLPFDYIFAYADTIKHSLDTDFSEWFNIKNLKVCNDDANDLNRKWTKHSIYRAASNDHLLGFFNHHDLTDYTTQETFKRRIIRYKEIINSKENIVFLTTSSSEDIKNNGLLDYYSREGKSTFVYLENIGLDSQESSIVLEEDCIKIQYKINKHIGTEDGKNICNILSNIDNMFN